MPSAEKTFVELFAAFPPRHRAAFEKIRAAIHKLVPDAEESVSYGMPAFRVHGKPFAGFGASANHCSYFPMDGSTVAVFTKELEGFDTSKGTIRFTPEKPLPMTLVRKLVKARVAEIEAAANPRRTGSKKHPDI